MHLNQIFESLTPLQVGAYDNLEFDGYVHDNNGEHISNLNPFYCELTGHYWAWKNQTADYYGFFHYRRFLNFNLLDTNIYSFEYSFSHLYEKYNYKNATEIISSYDIIVPKPEKFYTTVYNHYKNAKQHYIADFDTTLDIVRKLYPDFNSSIDQVINNNFLYIGNIFIMSNTYFKAYSDWLFSILFEFDRVSSHKNPRSNGFLAERLLSIYMTYLKNNESLIRILELPRIHFEPSYRKFKLNVMTNFFLPPCSNRRLFIKKYWRNK